MFPGKVVSSPVQSIIRPRNRQSSPNRRFLGRQPSIERDSSSSSDGRIEVQATCLHLRSRLPLAQETSIPLLLSTQSGHVIIIVAGHLC